MNLFGRKKPAAAAAADPADTILKLRSTVETLEKRQIHLDKKIEQQLVEAKVTSSRVGCATFCPTRSDHERNARTGGT